MTLSEKDLNELNKYAYNVDEDKHKNTAVAKPIKDTVIRLGSGNSVSVVAMKDDNKTGFQGLAVAPIVNGSPDYTQITVVTAGTDITEWNDFSSALQASLTVSNHFEPAEKWLLELQETSGYHVTQLSGHSQGAFIIKLGTRYQIPTTVFNGWFNYSSLSDDELDYLSKNPDLFINYRHKSDLVVVLNDGNKVIGDDFGTVIWINGTAHSLDGWEFDDEGYLIVDTKNKKVKRAIKIQQVKNQTMLAMWQLNRLRERLTKSGGGLSVNEEIYLDDSQALATVKLASSSMKSGLETLVKIYQDGISQAEEVWTDGLSRAQGIGKHLTAGEILEALNAAGATQETIVSQVTDYYEEQIADTKKIGERFDTVASNIEASIQTLISQDQNLANELRNG